MRIRFDEGPVALGSDFQTPTEIITVTNMAELLYWSGQKGPIWDSHCTQNVRFRRMRTGISFTVSLADRLRLRAIVAAPRSLQKHVWRARIILLSDDGLGTMAIRAAYLSESGTTAI